MFIVLFLSQPKINPTEIVVDVRAKVLKDDVFQLFYLQKGDKSFSEKKSRRKKIKGRQAFQKISFSIPIDKKLTKIRLDVGQNREQRPLGINWVKLSTDGLSYKFGIREFFRMNKFVKYEKKTFVPSIISGKYDPYLVSIFDIPKIYPDLIQKRNFYKKPLIYLIALVFSLLLFSYLNLVNFKIEKVLDKLFDRL